MRQFVFKDKDLTGPLLKRILFARAEYDLTYHCPACRVYTVDYSSSVSSADAKELAEALLAEAARPAA